MSPLRFISLVLPLLWVLPPEVLAQLNVSGDRISFDQQTGEQLVEGDARLERGKVLLLSDLIRIQRTDGTVSAEGRVRLTRGPVRILADVITYDLETGDFSATNYRGGRWPYYVEGDFLEGNVNDIEFRDTQLTYGEPERFSPQLRARRVYFDEDDRIRASGLTARFANVPIVYSNRFERRLGEVPLDVELEGGVDGDLGPWIQPRALWQAAPGVSLGAQAGLYSYRGLLLGPIADYQTEGAWQARGFLHSGYIYDFDPERDRFDEALPNNRYYLEWEHSQQIPQNWHLTARAGLWSDPEVTRDFADSVFDRTEEPDSFLEMVHSGQNSVFGGFIRYRPNDFQGYPQRLPSLRLEYFPTPVGQSDLLFSAQAEYVHLYYEDAEGSNQSSNRFRIGYSLDYPWSPTPWLSVTPTASLYTTLYANPTEAHDEDTYTRLLAEVGLDLEMLAHGQWDYQQPFWGIQGIRHTLRPIARYRYVPEADTGAANIPAVDLPTFTNYMRPISLRDLRAIDRLQSLHLVRVGVENVIQTKGKQGRLRDLARVDLFQDILFETDGEEDTWDRFYTRLELNPARFLSMQLFGSFDTEDLDLEELNGRVEINSGDLWHVAARTALRNGVYNQVFLDGSYRINERHRVLFAGWFDIKNDRISEHGYYLASRLIFPFESVVGIVFREDAQRESGVSLRASVNLLEF